MRNGLLGFIFLLLSFIFVEQFFIWILSVLVEDVPLSFLLREEFKFNLIARGPNLFGSIVFFLFGGLRVLIGPEISLLFKFLLPFEVKSDTVHFDLAEYGLEVALAVRVHAFLKLYESAQEVGRGGLDLEPPGLHQQVHKVAEHHADKYGQVVVRRLKDHRDRLVGR